MVLASLGRGAPIAIVPSHHRIRRVGLHGQYRSALWIHRIFGRVQSELSLRPGENALPPDTPQRRDRSWIKRVELEVLDSPSKRYVYVGREIVLNPGIESR